MLIVGKVRTLEYKLKESKRKQIYYNSTKGKVTVDKIKKSLNKFYNSDEGIQLKQYLQNYAKTNYSGIHNPMYGRKHIEQSKQLMSTVKCSHNNIPWNKGKKGLYKHTEQSKQKLRIASTKYSIDFINKLRTEYKLYNNYTYIAKKYNMNPLCVSRLIRFGSTQYPNK